MNKIEFEKTLTKTSFARGWQCKKHLWFHRKEPLINKQKAKQTNVFRKIGNPLLELAFSLFPNGVNCHAEKANGEKDWDKSLDNTIKAQESGFTTLFHPTFFAGELLCDIHLITKKGNEWEAYIVKNATRVSEQNLFNAGFQYNVMEKAGFKISKFSFITINNKYTRRGTLEKKLLFTIKNYQNKILEILPNIEAGIDKQLKTLKLTKAPTREIGIHCSEPRSCTYKSRCWNKLPNDSVFDLVGFSKIAAFQLWKRGIKTIADIPETQDLSFNQEVQRKLIKSVNKNAISSFLEHIHYPVLLVDFEAFVPAIPQFEHSRPFELIPFLFTGINLEKENVKGVPINHICGVEKDSRKEFALQFIAAAKNANTLLVYDPLTEKNIIKSLIKLFPELKLKLISIRDKIVDLAIPIKQKDFYLPEMKGYYGMKYVLPAIDPELHYGDLEIQSGRMAATMYQLLRNMEDKQEIEKQLKHLVEYCERDTLGLFKLFEVLNNEVK
tara:strand:- start:114 stop:1604 length:1491 start_codon:yes stop_codon:yes gene_type:complete